MAACVPLALLLITRPVRLFWHASGALCTVELLAYIASRTVACPGRPKTSATGDKPSAL